MTGGAKRLVARRKPVRELPKNVSCGEVGQVSSIFSAYLATFSVVRPPCFGLGRGLSNVQFDHLTI